MGGEKRPGAFDAVHQSCSEIALAEEAAHGRGQFPPELLPALFMDSLVADDGKTARARRDENQDGVAVAGALHLQADEMPPRRRHELLLGLGYEPHPALPDGRVNTVVMPDAGRPRLYVKKGSLLLNLTSGAAVQEAYERAQTKTVTHGAAFISPAS